MAAFLDYFPSVLDHSFSNRLYAAILLLQEWFSFSLKPAFISV